MLTVDMHGMELFYELHGTGKPLVLIAGYTGDHTFWSRGHPASSTACFWSAALSVALWPDDVAVP